MMILPEDKQWRDNFEFLASMRWLHVAYFPVDEKIKPIEVNGEIYQAKYLFKETGESTVYLTEDQKNVVKEYRGARISLAHYRIAATSFYQEKGIPVVPISNFSFDPANIRAFIVKPYVKGMTTDYLVTEEVVRELGQEMVDRMMDAENKLASNVFAWHEGGGFSYWLEENGIDEQDFGEYQCFVRVSDIWRDGKTIFTLEEGWRVLDP
ncbi:MAG TPA: hypothetical protein DCY27_10400 [Desulfobacterales bacterium]|nr:hypothetical protein [Desulfobacterales bacterium]